MMFWFLYNGYHSGRQTGRHQMASLRGLIYIFAWIGYWAFSCTCWPFVHAFWRNVCSSLRWFGEELTYVAEVFAADWNGLPLLVWCRPTAAPSHPSHGLHTPSRPTFPWMSPLLWGSFLVLRSPTKLFCFLLPIGLAFSYAFKRIVELVYKMHFVWIWANIW